MPQLINTSNLSVRDGLPQKVGKSVLCTLCIAHYALSQDIQEKTFPPCELQDLLGDMKEKHRLFIAFFQTASNFISNTLALALGSSKS
jgi:hypothetical protein